MPIGEKARVGLHQFWADVRSGKRVHPAKIFWDEVHAGKRPHPTRGKKYVKNIVPPASPETKHLTEFVLKGAGENNQKQSHPSPPEKRTILGRIKVATLQLVEIDSIPVREIEDTFSSIDECERGLLVLDQLATRVERLHVLVSYCKELHTSTLKRIRAHEKSTIPR